MQDESAVSFVSESAASFEAVDESLIVTELEELLIPDSKNVMVEAAFSS